MSLLLKLATGEQEQISEGNLLQSLGATKTISGELSSRFNKKFICNRARRVARGKRGKKIRQIARRQTILGLISEQKQLEDNPIVYRKPMKINQHRGDMIKLSSL